MAVSPPALRPLRWALVRWARGGGALRPAAPRKVYFLVMYPWGMGGTVRTALNTAAHLARTHEVEVLGVMRTRDSPFFEFPPGVTVTTIDDRRTTVPRGLVRRLLERCPSLLFSRADGGTRKCTLWTDVKLARTLRSRRAGALIGTRPGLNLVAAYVAAPSLVKVGQEHLHLSAHRRRLRRAIGAGYPKLDAVAVLTEVDRAAYAELLDGSLRVERIPNSVAEFGGAEPDLSAKTVLAAGRLTRQKDFGSLIRAFAQVADKHPDWRLRICGGGPRRRRLARLIAERGLEDSVVLTGPVRRLGDEMANASIFALSSKREGFPMVLIEAMSKGLPVVSFDCPTGPREIVRDRENGLLVPHGNVDALAGAINEMIEDEELRRRCGAGARATAARYSIDVIGARWEELLAELGVRTSSTS